MPTIVNEEKWFDNYYKNIEKRWGHKAKYYHFAGIRDGFVVGDGVEIMGFFIRGRRIVRDAVRLAATMTMPSKGAWDQLGVIVKSRASTGVAPMDGSAAKKLKVWEKDLKSRNDGVVAGGFLQYATLVYDNGPVPKWMSWAGINARWKALQQMFSKTAKIPTGRQWWNSGGGVKWPIKTPQPHKDRKLAASHLFRVVTGNGRLRDCEELGLTMMMMEVLKDRPGRVVTRRLRKAAPCA